MGYLKNNNILWRENREVDTDVSSILVTVMAFCESPQNS